MSFGDALKKIQNKPFWNGEDIRIHHFSLLLFNLNIFNVLNL